MQVGSREKFAQRQEATLPVVEPSSVTVTVPNPSGSSSLRVDSISLELGIGSQSVAGQYVITAPVLPATVAPSDSEVFLFRVTPKAGATIFEAVTITATISSTDLSKGRAERIGSFRTKTSAVTFQCSGQKRPTLLKRTSVPSERSVTSV